MDKADDEVGVVAGCRPEMRLNAAQSLPTL